MAKTEFKVRLLKKDSNSPSGYRIVGIEWHINGRIYHCPVLSHMDDLSFYSDVCDRDEIILNQEYDSDYIEHDATEFGIRVDDEDWFEGDIIEYFRVGVDGEKRIILYRLEYEGGQLWEVNMHVPTKHTVSVRDLMEVHRRRDGAIISKYKRIGNIHDGKD